MVQQVQSLPSAKTPPKCQNKIIVSCFKHQAPSLSLCNGSHEDPLNTTRDVSRANNSITSKKHTIIIQSIHTISLLVRMPLGLGSHTIQTVLFPTNCWNHTSALELGNRLSASTGDAKKLQLSVLAPFSCQWLYKGARQPPSEEHFFPLLAFIVFKLACLCVMFLK